MAFQHQSRRYHGNPLLQPDYDFRDVPYTSRDLSGSTLSVVTERQHLVDSIAEFTLLCNEATRRKKPDASSSLPSSKKTTKPLSIEYIFDRIDTDDPLWGLMVRTDTPMSFKGRASNMKSSPNWKRGMLQGFITMTTFTNWQSSFRFDSLHEMAFGQDEDDLEDQMRDGLRKYDEDGSLAEELEASVKCGNPHVEGIVYPRIAEVALFGGLGCGKQLLRLLIEHLERLKATAKHNYDYVVLQATDNSIPFYESMGFTRVGCVQGKAPSPKKIHTSPHFDYTTKKNGETPATIAKEFGVDPWDVVFLNRPVYPELVQKSWLKKGTKIFVPKAQVNASSTTGPKWYVSEENETPRTIANKFQVNFSELLQANKRRYPDLTGNSRLMEGTRIQVSRFDHDEGDMMAYSHWTFADVVDQDESPSYMMALKLNRKKGLEAKVKPVEESLAVSIQPYCPKTSGAKSLLLQPKVPKTHVPLAPIFTKKPSLKEPKKPKRPTTSYAHFTSDARSEFAAELEGMPLLEINKVLSEKWKALSDEEKAPYQKRFEESKTAYIQAMKNYEADMERFRRESVASKATTEVTEVDTSLLEKVVKLKPNHGISGASKFEYYYVLTFIPDLQWVHLIPMRKVGVYGPEYPEACGRPIWMIVGEDEGKEFDTTASVCQPVYSITMKNSADADDEQWNIYDNGEIPPAPRPAPTSLSKVEVASMPDAPIRPKKPATSFAFFCGDAKDLMKEQLGNKPISERTKIIAERWNVMSDEEKKKYKDQHTKAQEKYSVALKQYKEDLVKFQRENPGVDVSLLSSKTPKSAKKNKSSAVTISTAAGTVDSQKKRGRPRKDSLPGNSDTGLSSSAISAKTPKSSKKSPAMSTPFSAENGGSQKKKRGRPKKNPLPENPEAEQDFITPTPKRKRGRPRKSCLPDGVLSTTKAVVHTVKKDPVLLEQLIDRLKSGVDPETESNPDRPDKGITLKKTKLPVNTPTANSLPPGENDVVLSLLKDKYRSLMWKHFKMLGKKQKGGCGESEVAREIIETFKKEQGCRFFKKSIRSDDVFQVSESVALDKITSDLQRRMDSAKKWLVEESVEESPTLSPTRRKRHTPQSGPATAEAKPLLSPSRNQRQKLSNGSPAKYHSGENDSCIPSQPAEGLPEGWLTRKIPRKNPKDSRVDTRWYSPELNLKFRTKQEAKLFAQKVETLGEGEAAAIKAMSPSKDVAKAQKRPLAPIFLKGYGKKKQLSAQDSDTSKSKASPKTSRYPERKRKQVIDNHVVSDDAVSDTSAEIFEPKPKRRKTKC